MSFRAICVIFINSLSIENLHFLAEETDKNASNTADFLFKTSILITLPFPFGVVTYSFIFGKSERWEEYTSSSYAKQQSNLPQAPLIFDGFNAIFWFFQ